MFLQNGCYSTEDIHNDIASSILVPSALHVTRLTCSQRPCFTCLAARKGAFVAGQPTNFHGKILYDKCRKYVCTPSDWDPRLVERSSELPDARLVLEFVYGYAGGQ